MDEFQGLENLSPEELDALIAAISQGGKTAGQQAIIAKQFDIADELRKTPMPTGRVVRDQYIAGNPLEYLNAAVRQIQGGQGQAGSLRDSADLVNQNAKDNETYLRAMLAQLRQPKVALQPNNGAMMSPDPSTMTSEAVDPFAIAPWDDPLTKAVKVARKVAPPLTDQSPQRGRGYGG